MKHLVFPISDSPYALRRRKLLEDMLVASSQLAKVSQDDRANIVLNWLREHLALRWPLRGSGYYAQSFYRLGEGAETSPVFLVIQDPSESPELTRSTSTNAHEPVCNYSKSLKTIYCELDSPLTQITQTMDFLHAASHAYDYRSSRRGRPMKYNASELMALQMLRRLEGHPDYDAVLREP